MRHALAVLVAVGCSGPPSGPTVELYPGPVATVTQGNLLQVAARVDPALTDSITYDLVIDDPVAALFDVHTITQTDTGAIVSLVPSCAALNGAPNGVVAMSVGAVGQDIPGVALTIDIVADMDGVCAGAPEHAVTVVNAHVATVPDPARALCTRATIGHRSAHAVHDNTTRELLRLYGPTGEMASNGHILCGADDVRLELWPAIDAPEIESIQVDTFACDTDGCESPANTCCDAHPERTTPLTGLNMDVPIKSVAEVDDNLEGDTIACADLDGNGTPELVVARANQVTTEIGDGQRFTPQVTVTQQVKGLLGIDWQSGLQPSDVEWAVFGGVGSEIRRAHLDGTTVSWESDPRLHFDTGSAIASPDAMLPIPTTPTGGAQYVARRDGDTIVLSCISDACAADPMPSLSIAHPDDIPIGFGIADVDGDGDEDFVVAYRDSTGSVGDGLKTIHIWAFVMDWTQPTSAPRMVVLVPNVDVPGYDVQIVGSPSTDSCQRIYVVSANSSITQLATTTCGATLPAFTATSLPIVNTVHSIAVVNQRLIAATALGVFELKYVGDDLLWHLQDPLLEEQVLLTGDTLIDPTHRYAELFVPCFSSTPSIAFRTARGHFEWTQLDAHVQTFSVGSSP